MCHSFFLRRTALHTANVRKARPVELANLFVLLFGLEVVTTLHVLLDSIRAASAFFEGKDSTNLFHDFIDILTICSNKHPHTQKEDATASCQRAAKEISTATS